MFKGWPLMEEEKGMDIETARSGKWGDSTG